MIMRLPHVFPIVSKKENAEFPLFSYSFPSKNCCASEVPALASLKAGRKEWGSSWVSPKPLVMKVLIMIMFLSSDC